MDNKIVNKQSSSFLYSENYLSIIENNRWKLEKNEP